MCVCRKEPSYFNYIFVANSCHSMSLINDYRKLTCTCFPV